MDKYYTPNIEEFYIGFEFELFETVRNELEPKYKKYTNEWFSELHSNDKYWKHRSFIKKICNKNTVWEFSESTFKQKYTPLNIENIVRVKYLDKEDIESLGFTLDNISENKSQEIYFKDNVIIYYRYNTRKLGIITRDPSKNDYYSKYNKDPYSIHSITIKNKSELIKLLKQLDIG